MTDDMPRPMLSVREVQRQLGVCSKTIYRLIHSKELRATKLKGVWRVRPEDLAKYIEERS